MKRMEVESFLEGSSKQVKIAKGSEESLVV